MSARPKPPADFDENPPLDTTFFEKATPAAFGEASRLRAALAEIIKAHETGRDLERAIADAKAALVAAQ